MKLNRFDNFKLNENIDNEKLSFIIKLKSRLFELVKDLEESQLPYDKELNESDLQEIENAVKNAVKNTGNIDAFDICKILEEDGIKGINIEFCIKVDNLINELL